jgi:hypothetical protein
MVERHYYPKQHLLYALLNKFPSHKTKDFKCNLVSELSALYIDTGRLIK